MYSQYFHKFSKLLALHTPAGTNISDLLLNEAKLRQLFEMLNLFKPRDYLANNVLKMTALFFPAHRDLLREYLNGEIQLAKIVCAFIVFAREESIELNKTVILECTQHYADDVEQTIQQVIFKRNIKSHINLLGYGIADAYHEKKLRNFLIQQGLADTVSIYGFDPCAKFDDKDVSMLTSANFSQAEIPCFDIILAKWVLHHVPKNLRWEDFIACVNHTCTDADVLIVEEGTFASKYAKGEAELVYELLFAFFDVIINIALHPDWFFTSIDADDFFIEYLSPLDLETINNGLQKQNHCSQLDCGIEYFQQKIIHYHMM